MVANWRSAIINDIFYKMDKLIEQAIKNCKINKYEKYFEQVCKEYKRLLESESMCEHPWASVMGDGEMKPAKCLKCGKYL